MIRRLAAIIYLNKMWWSLLCILTCQIFSWCHTWSRWSLTPGYTQTHQAETCHNHGRCSIACDSVDHCRRCSPPWFLPHDSFSLIPLSWFLLHDSSPMIPPPWFLLHDSSSMIALPWFLLPSMIPLPWSLLYDSPVMVPLPQFLSQDSRPMIPKPKRSQ